MAKAFREKPETQLFSKRAYRSCLLGVSSPLRTLSLKLPREIAVEGRRASPGRTYGTAICRCPCTASIFHVLGWHKKQPPCRQIAAPRPVDARLGTLIFNVRSVPPCRQAGTAPEGLCRKAQSPRPLSFPAQEFRSGPEKEKRRRQGGGEAPPFHHVRPKGGGDGPNAVFRGEIAPVIWATASGRRRDAAASAGYPREEEGAPEPLCHTP